MAQRVQEPTLRLTSPIQSPILAELLREPKGVVPDDSGHSGTCVCSQCLHTLWTPVTRDMEPLSPMPRAPLRKVYSSAALDHTSFEY